MTPRNQVEGLPPLPEGEWDGDRHVHPYVQDREPDYSAPGYTNDNGEECSREFRSHESRIAFHTIEPLIAHLTPLGMALVMQTILHWLYSPSMADEYEKAGVDPADLDVRNELRPFEELHGSALKEIHRFVERILDTCPHCGRRHFAGCDEELQPGAYVNAETGDSIQLRRVTETKAYVWAQVSESKEVGRVYDRDWFEQHFVKADDVAVLTPDPETPS